MEFDGAAFAKRTARSSKTNKVKNKAPAAIQITAEQLLREAKERQEEDFRQPQQRITDAEELADYRRTKRKMFEDLIRKNRLHVGSWLKYAQWEESQYEFDRARSVFERALDMDPRSSVLYIKYAEMEIRQRNVNHARNIWDRAVTILPRIDQIWYKYVYMEEKLGNIPGCRQVFERWLSWQPEESAWQAYINMEKRYKETERARNIYRKFVQVHPDVKSWLKFAKFEEDLGEIEKAREVYEKAMEVLGEEYADERLYIAFAKFEVRCREFERARVIFRYSLDHLGKEKAQELFKTYALFEKQHGERKQIDDVIVAKKRLAYEEELKKDGRNYDTWFDYLRLEESQGELEKTRELYERAIANLPPAPEKRLWKRYIYLWINYALFEELEAEDVQRTREVYNQCLKAIPHHLFTFSKIWILFAEFEIRQKDLTSARKILGTALGKTGGRLKLYKAYIDLELQLFELDKCRALYGKLLEFNPANVYSWIRFAELEKGLGEEERARGIFEMAIQQPLLDMPELLWKAYIDFEYAEGEHDRTRALYERLLDRTNHVKVWISFAEMEASLEGEGVAERTRAIFKKAEKALATSPALERVLLLEAWEQFEEGFGDEKSRKEIKDKMPKKVTKRRKVQTDDGLDAGWEEYIDYIFPEEQAEQPHLKLLAMAHMWKQQMAQDSGDEEEGEEGEEGEGGEGRGGREEEDD